MNNKQKQEINQVLKAQAGQILIIAKNRFGLEKKADLKNFTDRIACLPTDSHTDATYLAAIIQKSYDDVTHSILYRDQMKRAGVFSS